MARPAKSVKVKSGEISSAEKQLRQEIEEKLCGPGGEIIAPDYLTDDQREIFEFIVSELKDSEILGRLDVYAVESTAIAISKVRQINEMGNKDPDLLSNTALQGTRAKYQQDVWRGLSELCLSPQARAKIGSLAAQAAKHKEDPLLKALMEDD